MSAGPPRRAPPATLADLLALSTEDEYGLGRGSPALPVAPIGEKGTGERIRTYDNGRS